MIGEVVETSASFEARFRATTLPDRYILSLIDNSHPATAEFFDDAIVRNGLADHCSRILLRSRILRLRNGQGNEYGT
jgi:hypothetical protein